MKYNRTKTLTKEEVLRIPELIKSKTAVQIAFEFGTTPKAIYNWIQKLRANGHEVITKTGKRPIELKNETQP